MLAEFDARAFDRRAIRTRARALNDAARANAEPKLIQPLDQRRVKQSMREIAQFMLRLSESLNRATGGSIGCGCRRCTYRTSDIAATAPATPTKSAAINSPGRHRAVVVRGVGTFSGRLSGA